MRITRRKFFQSSILAGAGVILNQMEVNRLPAAAFFGVNPFILDHQDAVFIMKTNVDVKTNYSAIQAIGLDFGRSVFCLTDNSEEGYPLDCKIVIKPNLTCRQRDRDIYTRTGSMGIVTDAYFVEGIIEGLKELSIPANQFYIREVNCSGDFADGGYIDMAQRTGIDLKGINTPALNIPGDLIRWVDVPGGVYFKKIPYLLPVNGVNTCLLNISKFKSHSMGLTLCAKNIQGTIAMNYQAHCTDGIYMSGVMSDHVCTTASGDITANYQRHIETGIPRWDKPGSQGGLWMETWATRCLDNNSATIAGLHIIEGIYGRDGNFLDGPANGLATDYMTNYIIFGKNQFYVDIIGHYLAGHEPGNFGLFHMAMERGMISNINPSGIPVYEWNTSGDPLLKDISYFNRYDLKTLYLQKNYGGNNEPLWHMVNEYYNYPAVGINDISYENFCIGEIFPNPVQDTATISFQIPVNGRVSVKILNIRGELEDVLVNKQLDGGKYILYWDSNSHAAGLYYCRIQFKNSFKTMKIIVLH